MKVGELVSFHTENFFEGAVQLRWVDERPAQAEKAANAFVFHSLVIMQLEMQKVMV